MGEYADWEIEKEMYGLDDDDFLEWFSNSNDYEDFEDEE